MVRAFTISFEFEGRTHLALASVKTSAEEGSFYTVHVYDDTLLRIVPEQKFSYTSQRPLCPHTLKHPNAMRLFTCINQAVVDHLQASSLPH